jgi:hypothetical protein
MLTAKDSHIIRVFPRSLSAPHWLIFPRARFRLRDRCLRFPTRTTEVTLTFRRTTVPQLPVVLQVAPAVMQRRPLPLLLALRVRVPRVRVLPVRVLRAPALAVPVRFQTTDNCS